MKKFFILLAVALTAVCLSSCDDEEVRQSPASSSLVGTWRYTESEGSDHLLVITMTFNPDGTYCEYGVETAPHGSFPWNESGFYSYDAATRMLGLTELSSKETDYMTAIVSDNMLTLISEDEEPMVYYRQ